MDRDDIARQIQNIRPVDKVVGIDFCRKAVAWKATEEGEIMVSHFRVDDSNTVVLEASPSYKFQ